MKQTNFKKLYKTKIVLFSPYFSNEFWYAQIRIFYLGIKIRSNKNSFIETFSSSFASKFKNSLDISCFLLLFNFKEKKNCFLRLSNKSFIKRLEKKT